MKLLFTIAITLSFTFISFSQLRVTPTGSVGIGITTPAYGAKLHVRGVIWQNNLGHAIQSIPNATSAYGSSSDRLAFWYTDGVGHNLVYAQKYYVVSDSSLKTNIKPLKSGLDVLLKLKTYSYNMRDDKSLSPKPEYGFISQEVGLIIPGITDTSYGDLTMSYDQLIPFLVNGTKELHDNDNNQSAVIDSLSQRIIDLEQVVYGEKDNNSTLEITTLEEEVTTSVLYQNTPNPFKQNTTIRFNIIEEMTSASIMVFNMNGGLIKTVPLTNEQQELTIRGGDLKAGMYLYTLVVDGNEIDTKRMILQK